MATVQFLKTKFSSLVAKSQSACALLLVTFNQSMTPIGHLPRGKINFVKAQSDIFPVSV
jgi:hypothetical protein